MYRRHPIVPSTAMLTVVFLVIACNSKEPPVPTAILVDTAASSVTPAKLFSEIDLTPTPRPNAAVQRGPTPTPVAYLPPTLPTGDEYRFADVAGLSSTEWELNGYGSLKQPPPTLDMDSDSLDIQSVIELWTELLGDTRFIVNGSPIHLTEAVRQLGDFDLLFCSAGYGIVMDVPPSQIQNAEGSVFEWSIEHSVASPWWGPTLKLSVRDPNFIPAYAESGGLGQTQREIHRRAIFAVGGQIWVDRFTHTELLVSLLNMTNPKQFCDDSIPDRDRLF